MVAGAHNFNLHVTMAKSSLQDKVATPCRSAGDLYQALVGSNGLALTGHCAACSLQLLMSFTFCEEYKPPGVFLNFSMSALPKTTQRETGQVKRTAPR